MIEKGSLKVGDRLEGTHKSKTYHALVNAANGDDSLVYKAEDGPAAGKEFTSLSALAAATGSVRNGWTFWSPEGLPPVKGGRPAKHPNGQVKRYRCTACGHIYRVASQAEACRCKVATADVVKRAEAVMVDPMGPAKDAPAGGLVAEKPARKGGLSATAQLDAVAKTRKVRAARVRRAPVKATA